MDARAPSAREQRILWTRDKQARRAVREAAWGQPTGTIAWRYQVTGQGERAWHVYAPPEMPADAVESYVTAKRGPLATFERAEAQPKGALNCQSEETASGNSRYFGAEAMPRRPFPFVWRAWQPWRVEHPPDG